MRPSKIAVDIAPLRDSRDFRLLYAGRFVSLFGSALTTIAVSWQVYEITHAALMVGVNSLLTSLATVSGLLKGGVLADRHDRRRVLLATRIPQAAVSALLAANSAAGDRPGRVGGGPPLHPPGGDAGRRPRCRRHRGGVGPGGRPAAGPGGPPLRRRRHDVRTALRGPRGGGGRRRGHQRLDQPGEAARPG